MRVIAFIEEPKVIDKIIRHLKLSFIAERPPPPHNLHQELLMAAFNKGISGGGYGPVVTSGQIMSGVKSKKATGITSLAEGLTCLVGVITYLIFTNHAIEWELAPSLVLGAVLSVPFAAYTVK